MKRWKTIIISFAIMFLGLLCQPMVSQAASPGLYNANGQLVYTWKQLTNNSIVNGGVLNVYNGSLYLCENGHKYLKGKLVISDSVKEIGGLTFADCEKLTAVTIPNSVKTICDNAFYNSGLKKITIPKSVTSIGNCIFAECDSLKEIKVNSNNKVYNSNNNCNAIIKTKTKEVVAGCSESVIPSGVKKIREWAFFGLLNLKKITIPDSVTTIGEYAFFGCENLKNITIPKSVTKIGQSAFGWVPLVHNKSSAKGSPWGASVVHKYAKAGCPLCNIKITFNPNGGTVSKKTKTVSKGFTYGSLPTPTRKGYTFSGWYTAKTDGKKITASSKVTVSKAQTLYARWTVKKYKITYNFNGGSKISGKTYPATYTINKAIEFPNAKKKGYTFAGWYTDKNFTNKITKIAKGTTGNKTLYAKWKANTYTVVFYKTSSSTTSTIAQQFTYGKKQTLTPNLYTKKGYIFQGWSKVKNGEVVYTDGQEVLNLTATNKGKVSLYGSWRAITYHINYNGNGATAGNMESQTSLKYDKKISLSQNRFTKTSYKFMGWSTTPNGEVEFTDEQAVSNITTVDNATITLYASWKKLDDYYNVQTKYKGNYSNNNDDNKVISYNAIYSDRYFENDASDLQEDLSIISMAGAATAYNKQYALQFLGDCGFVNREYCFSSNTIADTAEGTIEDNDHVKYAVGTKVLSDSQGRKYTLAAVLVRGTKANYEWISNFNLGTGDYHEGFKIAADEVYTELLDYLKNNTEGEYVKVWVTGHSRGAAVANLLAVKLNEKYGSNNVYAYTFATPRVADSSVITEQNNIFNYLNPGDFVTEVAPKDWGYERFGEDITFTTNTKDEMNINFKELTNLTYNGFSESEKTSLVESFITFGESKEIYYNGRKVEKYYPETGETVFVRVYPAHYCQDGLAMALVSSAEDKAKGAAVMTDVSSLDYRAADLTIKLGENGVIKETFRHAHCMSSYIAWLEAMYN